MPQWYWESGHFKADLGTRMLAVMAGNGPAEGLFGIELTPETIDSTLTAIRQSRQRYAEEQPGAVAEISDAIGQARTAKALP